MSDKLSVKGSIKSPFKNWSSEQLTPRDLLSRFPLPSVVRVCEGGQTPPNLDLSVPLLLYKRYNSKKVHARSLRDGKEVGAGVVIPDGYTGWFSMVEGERSAIQFTSLEEVVQRGVGFFLSCTSLQSYRREDESTPHPVYRRVVVSPGSVLRILGVYQDMSVKDDGKKRPAYVQCLDHKSQVLYIPVKTSGRFYSVGTRGSQSPHHVYLLPHLLRARPLPLTVRLVCGYLPTVPKDFTGTLRLERLAREELILACTLLKEKYVILEISADSQFKLNNALNPEKYAKSPLYQGALATCQKDAEQWRRQIKVTYHVTSSSQPPLPPIPVPPVPQETPPPSYQGTWRSASFKERFDPDSLPKKNSLVLNDSIKKEKSKSLKNYSSSSETVHSVIEIIPLNSERVPQRRTRIRQRLVPTNDVPYATVRDDLTEVDENIYAEICDMEARDDHCSTIKLQNDVGVYYSKVPELELSSSSASSSPEDTLNYNGYLTDIKFSSMANQLLNISGLPKYKG